MEINLTIYIYKETLDTEPQYFDKFTLDVAYFTITKGTCLESLKKEITKQVYSHKDIPFDESSYTEEMFDELDINIEADIDNFEPIFYFELDKLITLLNIPEIEKLTSEDVVELYKSSDEDLDSLFTILKEYNKVISFDTIVDNFIIANNIKIANELKYLLNVSEIVDLYLEKSNFSFYKLDSSVLLKDV